MPKILFFCLMLLSACAESKVSWTAIEQEIATKFPEVTQIEASELKKQNPPYFMIIDVRDAEEYQVSHLEHALHIQNLGEIKNIALSHPEQTVLLYCSVGYRSSQLAHELNALGVSNVANLKGSIFEWVHRGYSVVNSEGPTDKVHPYNEQWGALLQAKYRAKL
jgi:rhodanese-related sulfurtransferase